MNPYIGIIVPFYNTEDFLDECIASILKQSYQHFKLILVNDNSTDNSLKICQDYAAQDSRITILNTNGLGVAGARNTGLKYCLKDKSIYYISFIDSDDCVDKLYLEQLFFLINTTNSDISMCSFDRFENETHESYTKKPILTILDNNSFWFLNFAGGSDSVLWNKLYKIDVVRNVVFPEGKIHEDEHVLHYIIENSSKITMTNNVLYHYRIRPGSIMHNNDSDESVIDLISALIDRILFFQKIKKDSNIKYQTYCIVLNYLNNIKGNLLLGERKKIKKLFKKDSNCFSIKQKIIIAIKINKSLSNLLWHHNPKASS